MTAHGQPQSNIPAHLCDSLSSQILHLLALAQPLFTDHALSWHENFGKQVAKDPGDEDPHSENLQKPFLEKGSFQRRVVAARAGVRVGCAERGLARRGRVFARVSRAGGQGGRVAQVPFQIEPRSLSSQKFL